MKKLLLLLAVLGLVFGGNTLAQTITVGQGSEIVTLDPHGQNDQPSARVRVQIYDTLVIQEEDLSLVPGLAESWEQVDETTWDFFLREGVTFHNGDPLTAADVVFTFNRMRDPATAAPAAFLLGFMESVEAVNDMTVRIHTQYPFAPLLNHLSHGATGILNERSVTDAGPDYGTTVAIGTGPFRFVSWEPATRLVLERNEDWWRDEVLPARVIFRPITEGTVRAIELETGVVDIAYTLEPSDANRFRRGENPAVRLESVETLTTSYIGFNVQQAPFDDARVRQAINYAIDSELIADVVYTGQATPANSPIMPRVFGAHPALEPYGYNPERARELLAEAGYAGGFSTTLWTNDNPLRIQIAEIVQAMLADLNINVDVQVLEWGTYLSETAAGNHDMFILGWVTVTGDADYGLYSLFHSTQFGNPGNRTFFGDPRVDELLDLGRVSADEQERLDAYREVQEIIRDEAPWIFLIWTTEDNGVRQDIQGFDAHPAGHHRLYSVSRTQ